MSEVQKMGFTYLSFKALYSYQTIRLFILFRIVDPLMHYLFYAILASSIVGSNYFKYVVIGNIAAYTCHTVIINFMNMFRMERRYRTLELNIASPMPNILIIIRKSIVPLLDGILVFSFGLIFGSLLFNLHFPFEQIINLLLIFIITIFSIMSFSLLFAGVSLIFSNVNLVLNIVLGVFQVFCGVNFSVTLFPSWIEFFSRKLPLTHSVEALRSIYHLEQLNIYPLIVTEFLIGLIYFFVALLFISILEKQSRKNGALFKGI